MKHVTKGTGVVEKLPIEKLIELERCLALKSCLVSAIASEKIVKLLQEEKGLLCSLCLPIVSGLVNVSLLQCFH